MKNVAISGINGRMGRLVASIINHSQDYNLVFALGKSKADYIGKDLGEYFNMPKFKNIIIDDNIDNLINLPNLDVIIDHTNRHYCLDLAIKAITKNIPFITGSSGLTPDILEKLGLQVKEHKGKVLIVPNFSLGAVLMMEFAAQASKWFDYCEIVELHDPKKTDAPSGTSLYTADKIEKHDKTFNVKQVEETELIPAVRGGITKSGLRIHSLRMPGVISQQEVNFGANGELLKISHTSFNTQCFSHGIILALSKIDKIDGLVRGLENILNT